MKIEDGIRAMRKALIKRDGKAVPESFQGVTKQRIEAVLGSIDLRSPDMVDAVFALLDDRQTWFTTAPAGTRFCEGATTAHIGCHVGILQRGQGKLDREGRDYWLKPLRGVGAIETVTLTDSGFVAGHIVAKSSNSAYRLDASFIALLRSDAKDLERAIATWIDGDARRQRLERQAQAAEAARQAADNGHSDLIRAVCTLYARHFLPGYELLFVDDGDGDRLDAAKQTRLASASLRYDALGAMPDALFWKPGTNEFAVIEAVTSDGEVDQHKVDSVTAMLCRSHKNPIIHFVTAYRTWKEAAARQGKHKNLAPGSWLWIMEDGSRRFHVEATTS
jgi:hypothetical protein